MDNYKPNSHKSREEADISRTREKPERVVSGTAKVKQKNEIRKIADAFVPEDVSNIKSYFIWDVLVPNAKKAILDIVCMCLNIDDPSYKRKSSGGSKISYRDYYDRGDSRRSSSDSRRSTRFECDDIVIPTRGEAEAVLDQMDDMIRRYKFVSVLDLYDICGLDTPPYTSDRYGWIDLRTARVVPVRDGYILKLPKAVPFD